MDTKERDLFRLEHIWECIGKIEEIVRLVGDIEVFRNRWIEQDALLRNFEIIGEASNHVSEIIKTKYPEVEWFKMKGMRNLISHEYFGVRIDTIWETAIKDIPLLKHQMKRIIEENRP